MIDNDIFLVQNIMSVLESEGQTDNALAEALSDLRSGLDAEYAVLWLINREDMRLYAITHSGSDPVTGLSIECSEGLLGKAIRHRISEMPRYTLPSALRAKTFPASAIPDMSPTRRAYSVQPQ